MGCNCNGARDRRLAARAERQAAAQARVDATIQPPVQPATGSANTTESQNRRAATIRQSFTLQRRDGTTQTFGSKLDAEAARVRGGGTII